MEEQSGWKVVKKIKKVRSPKNITIDDSDSSPVLSDTRELSGDTNDKFNNMEHIDTDCGDLVNLPYNYVLWRHDIYNKDWSLTGYNKLCTINNVSQFWKLFNNLDKLGFKNNNFFLMKEGTDPTWEHENNRNGGTCSFKTEINNSLALYEELCGYLVCNILVKDMHDINGISFSPKNNWAVIKIWNKDKKNDISKELNGEINKKYKDIGMRYKSNEPEY